MKVEAGEWWEGFFASEEMVLISPGGENLLHFLELLQVFSRYDACLHQEMAFERPVCKTSSVMLALSEARACAGSSGQLCNSIFPRELEPGPYKYDTNPAFHRR